MASVEILDRSTMTGKLYEGLVIDPKETAVVAIDMHRGHLDMSVATMPTKPEDAERGVRNAEAALARARPRGAVRCCAGDPRCPGVPAGPGPGRRGHDAAVLSGAARPGH